jgi:hypothetical protein
MKSIKAQFVSEHIIEYETRGDADRQSRNIDKGVFLVSAQIAIRDEEIIF